jgi:hypothetical protein
MKRITVWFNSEKDKDLIEKLESQPDSVSAYVKALIRKDLDSTTI